MSIPTTFEIDYKCGHSGTRDLSDVPAGQRAGKVEWLESTLCFDCFKAKGKRTLSKEVQAERAALMEAATEDAERSHFPVLGGSEKQTPWGTRVRYELMRDAYSELVEGGDMSEEEFEEKFIAPARRIGPAKWWIDNREATIETLPDLLADPGLKEHEYASENVF